MKVIKSLVLSLLSIILFFLVVVLGIAITVDQVALNPRLITKVVNEIDYSSLVDEITNRTEPGEKPLSPETIKVIKDTIANTQPLIKERATIGIKDVYDFALGKPNAPSLKTTLGVTFMNPVFTAKLLDKVDLSNLTQQMVNAQNGAPTAQEQAFQQAIVTSIDQMEPAIKQQLVSASDPIFKYLLGQTSTIDLRVTARNTFLSRTFISQVIDNLDMQTLTRDTLRNQIAQLPGGVKLTSTQLDQVVTTMSPSIKNGFKTNADSIGGYLAGARQTFNVVVQLSPSFPQIKPIMKQAFVSQLPANLKNASQTQIDQAFELYWAQTQGTLPPTFTLDSSSLGTGLVSEINNAFKNGQSSLAHARDSIDRATNSAQNRQPDFQKGVGYFRVAFIGIIILILLIIAGIFLIRRSVKMACRDLGITFLSYGAIVFIGLLILRNALPGLLLQNMSAAIASLVPVVIKDITHPLFVFSIVCLISGIGLVVVSIVYRKKQTL